MKITFHMINEDVKEIREKLEKESFVVPAMWSVLAPSIIVFVSFFLCQSLFSINNLIHANPAVRGDAYVSIGFSTFIGLIVSIGTASFTAQFLSVPDNVRKKSILIRHLSAKAKWYFLLWFACNVIVGICVLILNSGYTYASTLFQFISLMVFWVVFSIDISRYQLSTIKSLIGQWKKSK